MNGKVHSIVGITTCTLVMQPRNLEELLLCALTGSVGGLLPDIDIRNSEAQQNLKEVSVCGAIAGGIVLVYSISQGFNLLDFLHSMNTVRLAALVVLIVNVLIGMLSGHRKYTHSIEFALLISTCVLGITSNIILSLGMLLGILSHDLIDTLNKKKVLLSCIFKFKICFNVCSADSNIATAIGMLAGSLLIIYCGLNRIIL